MLTSKQRSYLRGLANTEPAIVHVGKNGIDGPLIKQARDAIVARELIKGKVQKNSLETSQEVAESLAESLKAEIVCVMGSTFVLFKRNPQDMKIEIPSKRTPNPQKPKK